MAIAKTAVITAIVADLAIAVAKGTAFFFTRSSAMLSETIHSLVDAGNSTLLLVGAHQSLKPADEAHPFGYGKELYFWTLLVALFIFLVGGGASIVEGIRHLLHPEPIEHVLWNYATLIVAACFEGYSLHVGLREFKKLEGVSASWKTIHASKNPATFTVIFEDTAAIAGLLTALIGTALGQFFGWERADGVASVVIGSLLMTVAVLLIVESKALLVGEGADLKTLRAIRAMADAEPGVERAGAPLTMYFGPDNVLLTMDIRFRQDTTRRRIEEAMESIEAKVRERYPNVKKIYLEAEGLLPGGQVKMAATNSIAIEERTAG